MARATFVEANFLCRRWTLIKIKSALKQSVPKFYPPRKLVYVISTTILIFIIVILYAIFIYYRAIYSERSVMKIATTCDDIESNRSFVVQKNVLY